MRLVAAAAVFAFSVFFAPVPARAAPCMAPIKTNFDRDLGGPTFAAAPASDASFPTGGAFTYHVATTIDAFGTTTLLRKFSSADASTAVCTATITGEKAVADPTPVPLSDGKTAIFLATDAGRVYRYNTDCTTGMPWTPDPAWVTPADVRRRLPNKSLLCTTGGQLDTILAAPTVMLSNPSYYGSGATAPAKDLVIVPTRYGCTSTDNRVIAIDASNPASIVWRSNIFAAPADYFSDSCSIDYNSGIVYCGANDPGGAYQSTLFGYNGSGTGTLSPVVQLKPGSVSTRLNLRNNHLIVGTAAGVLMGYDLTGVTQTSSATTLPSWSVNLGSSIRKSPVAEQRYGFQRTILVVTTDGRLHRVDEDPAFTAARVGPPLTPTQNGVATGGLFSTNLAMFSEQGKVYAGASDGYLYQIDFSGVAFNPATSVEGYVASIANLGGSPTTTATVYDPILDFAPAANPVVDRITIASVGRLRQYAIPWVTNCSVTSTWPSGGALCSASNPCPPTDSPECGSNVCLANGQCAFQVNRGSQGLACTSLPRAIATCVIGGGVCSDGRCVGVNYQRCNGGGGTCTNSDVNACAPNETCCSGVCASLANNADPLNCGGCGIVCDPNGSGDHQCRNGHCERLRNCTPPTFTQVKNSVPTKVSQLSFDYSPGGECRAYAAQTSVGSFSSVIRIDSSGNGTTITPRGANYNVLPINGTSVTRDGVLTASQQTAGSMNAAQIGMYLVPSANLDNFSTLYHAQFQQGTGVYADAAFDTDGVGPVFNDLYTARDRFRRVYIANTPRVGDLAFVDAQAGNPWTYGALTPIKTYPGRITALTFAIRQGGGGRGEGTLLVAYNAGAEAMVDVFCDQVITNKNKGCAMPVRTLDLGPATPVDFADAVDPDRALQLPAITGILSMSADQVYGGVFLTARDRRGNVQVLYLDSVGLSVRNYSTWPFSNAPRAMPNATIGGPQDDFRPTVAQYQLWALKLNGFQGGDYALAVWGTPR